jgi:ApaG protein
MLTTYQATTENITIKVRPIFVENQSDIIAKKFVFAYFVHIENKSNEPVQLLRRHWYIYDSIGEMSEVEGEGVVGQQPIIFPKKSHEYNSFCVLKSFEGYMEGTYLFERAEKEQFYVTIPRFTLRAKAN